jgi:hypothetical protein
LIAKKKQEEALKVATTKTNTNEYGAVKKVPFLTSHSKMLAIIQKGKVPYIRFAN